MRPPGLLVFASGGRFPQPAQHDSVAPSVNVPSLPAVYLYRPRLVSAIEKKFFDNASDRTRNKSLVGGIGFGKKSVTVELLQSRKSKDMAGAIWLDCTNNQTLSETLYDAISLMGGIPPKNNRNLSKLSAILTERIAAPGWEVVFADLKSVELAKKLSVYLAYTEQITFLLFLKMANEQTRPPYNRKPIVPTELGWASLLGRDGKELERHYPQNSR